MITKASGTYKVIYADPPWRFKNFSVKGEGRNAVSHYDCMSLEQLKGLPVSDLAAKDCCLFLWTTDPLLPSALELMNAWGFDYKTVGFHWVKLNKTANAEAICQKDFFCWPWLLEPRQF